MCYDIKTSLEQQLRRAILDSDTEKETKIRSKLSAFEGDTTLHHTSGFDHPTLFVKTAENTVDLATWGIVPPWAKTIEERNAYWNKTLNAKSETLAEKPSFNSYLTHGRCIVYVEGFYEHFHKNGKKFPHFIHQKGAMMAVAAVCGSWSSNEEKQAKAYFSIITQKANSFMAKIHNNPKLAEARMPAILTPAQEEEWIADTSEWSGERLAQFFKPTDDLALEAHTVRPLRGKSAVKNNPNASEAFTYNELEESPQLKLF